MVRNKASNNKDFVLLYKAKHKDFIVDLINAFFEYLI